MIHWSRFKFIIYRSKFISTNLINDLLSQLFLRDWTQHNFQDFFLKSGQLPFSLIGGSVVYINQYLSKILPSLQALTSDPCLYNLNYLFCRVQSRLVRSDCNSSKYSSSPWNHPYLYFYGRLHCLKSAQNHL